MLHHRVDQMDVGKIRIVEPQVGIGRAFLTQQVARRDAGAGDEAFQQGTRRRSLEVLNDMRFDPGIADRSEEHTSELQSLMRNSYAVFCCKKKTQLYNNR